MAGVGVSDLSVFLRNGTHAGATVRLALKCDQVSIQYSQTPIQISEPGADQVLFQLGFSKPSGTISGIVDSVGGDTTNDAYSSNQDENVKGLSYLTLNGETYYIPTKNFLEAFLMNNLAPSTSGEDLFLEIGDATTPDPTAGADSTGGGVYGAILQQLQFSQTPGLEDRWLFTIGFLLIRRTGLVGG